MPVTMPETKEACHPSQPTRLYYYFDSNLTLLFRADEQRERIQQVRPV